MIPEQNKINTGLDLKRQEAEQVKPEKHLMGVGSFWKEIKPDANWVELFLKLKAETQFGKLLETMGCTGYGTNKILQMIWFFVFNILFNISDRFTNKMSGTTKNGNTVDAPIDATRKYGFVLEEEYPWDRDTFTWEEYYKAVPKDVLAKAKARKDDWEFEHEYVPVGNKEAIKNALKTSPLGGTVPAWYKGDDGIYHDYGYTPNHWSVVIIGYKEGEYWLCGDSYPDDFQYNDNPQPQEFIKKLAWDFKFGCIKRYKITDKRDATKKKLQFLTLLTKSMENFYYYWDGKHNFYYIGVPAGRAEKYRQHIDWGKMTTTERFAFLALRSGMQKSSWAEISKFPDISEIGQKFA
jgi:hypothetical protein